MHVLAPERIGPVLSPVLPQAQTLAAGPPSALLQQHLLHTASRPQAWPSWAQAHGVDPAALRYGTGFEHLYYLLEAALAGIGVAIAPQPLVADDLASGRLLAPWGFADTGGQWALCTAGGREDQRIVALAAWLRTQLR